MDSSVLAVRNLTYRLFVDFGRAPTALEVAERAPASIGSGLTAAQVEAAWEQIHAEHGLVLEDRASGWASSGRRVAIRMAAPFSAVPTAFRVHAAGRWWYANCAWDAFGVCAALGVDGAIETACADCGDPIVVAVRQEQPDDPSLVFHCLVPAAHWWDDIVFT